MSDSVDKDQMIGREILNYVIIKSLGAGGMGSVYLAENKYIKGNKVAIKMINSDMANDYTRSRLREEAEILTTLNHPNIVKFINYQIDDSGAMFLIMQFAEGTRLDKYIRDVTGLIVEDKIGPLFEPILDAIEYAHQHNVLHRDIKPSNIIISPEGVPMVLDFGISSILNDAGELGDNRLIVGTPPYMSPELIKEETVDRRSDIYSLGVMLEYMLIGRSPYDMSMLSEQELNEKIVNEPLPRMKVFYPYISDKMQRIVDKATAKVPAKRYQSCADFKRDLHRAVTPDRWKNVLKKASVPCAVVLLGLSLFLFFHFHGVSRYYNDYTEVYNIPQGIGKVSLFSVGKHSELYRFYYRKGRLNRVSHINGFKNIIPEAEMSHPDRPMDMTFHYSENGKVSQIKAYDNAGKCLFVKSFNPNLSTVTYQYDDQYGTERTVTSGENGGRLDRITRLLQEYDDNGYLSKVNYASFQNQRVGNESGIYGERYVRDEKGRVKEVISLAFDDSPKATKWGLGKRRYSFDNKGNVVRVDYLTVNDQPASALPDDCYTAYECTYDNQGNRLSVKYLDSDGHDVMSKIKGVAGYRYYYKNGLLEKRESVGIDGSVVYDTEGFAVLSYAYDKNGYVSQVRYCDVDGLLSPVGNGIASVSFENDGKGTILVMKNYGLDGNLKLNSSGYAGTVASVDSVGNIIEYRTYGIDWTPCLNSDGSSGYLCKYNNLGLIAERVNVGVDDKPVPDVDGHFKVVYSYDNKSNLSSLAFYDADGKNLFLDNDGVAGYSYKYDDYGNLVEKTAFDENHKSCDSSDGVCKVVNTYDEKCNLVKVRNYDSAGDLIGGIAGKDFVYDERGNVLEEMSVDDNESLASGTLLTKYSYDNHDNVVEESFFDRYGKAAVDSLGIHRKVLEYNERNQAVSESYYGVDGRLTVMASDRYSSVHKDYDARGVVVKVSYYGSDGKPVLNKDGYSIKDFEFNSDNRISKMRFFDVEGKPTSPAVLVPEVSLGYDEWGNVNYEATSDGYGNLYVDQKKGYAAVKKSYDSRGNVLTESYFGVGEKAMIVSRLGYHKIKNKYDERSHLVECGYFDADDSPIEIAGVSRIKITYDADNNKTREDNYDKDGKIVKSYTYQYDGSKVTRKTFNSNDVLALTEEWNGKAWAVPAPPLLQLSEAYTRNKLPQQFSLSEGVVITFRQLKSVPSGKSLTAVFTLSESMYNTSSAVLSEAKNVISNAVHSAKKDIGVSSATVKVSLQDKAGREIDI